MGRSASAGPGGVGRTEVERGTRLANDGAGSIGRGRAGDGDRARVPVGGRLIVLYDADCAFCAGSAALLGRLDRARRLRLVPLQLAHLSIPGAPPTARLRAAMHVRAPDGRWEQGGAAWLQIATVVPALRPLAVAGRLPLLRRAVEPLYDLVARNRHWLGRLLGLGRCATRTAPPGSPNPGVSRRPIRAGNLAGAGARRVRRSPPGNVEAAPEGAASMLSR